MNICPVGGELLPTDRWQDMKNLLIAFINFPKSSSNLKRKLEKGKKDKDEASKSYRKNRDALSRVLKRESHYQR